MTSKTTPFLWRPPAVLLLLILLNGTVKAQDIPSSKCHQNELCTTVKRCEESNDSGWSIINPRLGIRSCGEGLMCCEKEQLDSWDASQGQPKSPPPAISSIRDKVSRIPEPKPNESCGLNMECVPRKLCLDNVINDAGISLINPRIGNTQCSRSLYRCCEVSQQVDESQSPYVQKQKDFQYKSCGWSNPQGLIPDDDKFNYTEDVSIFGQFPWMVGIFTGRQKFLCGGTLIHPRLVVTSSHNVVNETVETLVARVGEWDLNSVNEPYIHQSRRIKEIIMHPEFHPKGLFNDIALLVLEEPVQLAPHIQPICLPPPQTEEVTSQLLSANCFATGWGAKEFKSDRLEEVLKRINLPLVEHSECQAKLRVTRVETRFWLRPSFICAGGEPGKDTCKGDGGSPLFCTMPGERDRYQLVGIVSWGLECGEDDIPAVYANVPYLRPWLDEKIKGLGITL